MAVATPAQRARQRTDPAIGAPPVIPRAGRHSALRELQIVIAGVAYLIGPAIEGDPQLASANDSTATVTIDVRDPHAKLQIALANEQVILATGVSVEINGDTYMLQSVSVDTSTGTLVTLVFEDEVSWRLRQYTSFLAIPRSKYTRAQAALRLITEASGSPLAPISYYIPQLTDAQKIASPGVSTTSAGAGTGAGSYTVKGASASAQQRANIDAILTEALTENASTTVMKATIMAATQESGLLTTSTNGEHIGLFQQSPDWGSTAQRRDATESTKLFLAAWKTAYGSLKSAPGNLGAAIDGVQHSGLPALYLQWLTEAGQTVDTWTATDGTETLTVVEPFEFTRGSKGQPESSWDASADWASQVNWRRWAEHNTFFFVSDDELRQQAPSLSITGDEDWLLTPPAFDWNPNRAAQQVTLNVLADRWGLSIGACVMIQAGGPTDGRFLVTALSSGMLSPEVAVTLSRPATKLPEPAAQTQEISSGSGSVSTLLQVCKGIDAENHPYVYGGGHGQKLSSITASEGLDCSSSVSLALYRAGMFEGDEALVSGEFATSWGLPGVGKTFTVMANDTHVWIRFESTGTAAATSALPQGKNAIPPPGSSTVPSDAPQYTRFDTVGPGPSGPHLRTTPPPEPDRFTPRHWPGT